MIHKWFIMLLGMLKGSQAVAGQIPEPQIVLAQKSVAPVITVFRAESTPLLAPSFLLARNREKSLAHSSLRFPGPYDRDQAGASLAGGKAQDFDFHAVEPAARPTLGREAPAGRLSEYAGYSEWAVWRFRVRRHAGLSSSSTKFSGWVAFGPSLRPQSELSFWPGRADATPVPGMEESAADLWVAFYIELYCFGFDVIMDLR